LTAVFLFLFAALPAPYALAKELVSVDKAIKQAYGETAVFETQRVELSGGHMEAIEQEAGIDFRHGHTGTVLLHTVTAQESVLGYAFEDTVVGKWGPIRYLLALGVDGHIKEVIVLDYQEIRGKPVAKRRFLKQYDGKSIKDPLRLRQDIDGITGATISSRSMTDGIRKLLHVFRLLGSGLTH
jgi:Na+-translocating ferredoxin:NAD+ oxidoreductase RnfG subunit